MNNKQENDRNTVQKKETHSRLRRVLLSLGGFGALIWFLIRVVPKPSRANYPCMKVAAPMAAYFVISCMAFLSSIPLLRKARNNKTRTKRWVLALILAGGAGFGLISMGEQAAKKAEALTVLADLEAPNKPIGTGKGIFPGRVVWVYDTDATDEKSDNSVNWYSDKRTNLSAVQAMFSKGLQSLTGAENDLDAWDTLFRDFNRGHGGGDKPYTKGEKIAIKINLNGQGMGPQNINTSPQVCYSLLDQLINVVGVVPEDIHIGDPNIPISPKMYSLILENFPGVRFYRYKDVSPKSSGRDLIFASDGGKANPLPQSYVEASYLFNLPVLKKHHRAGISLTAKNHFGSITPFNNNGAFDWHYSLPVPNGGADNSNGEYKQYRCLVDFMGHEHLGGKTILYLVDGLWGSINWGHPAIKWQMSPFNNDWPSSLFLAQDPVAVESVGFDFLYNEFDQKNREEGKYDVRDDHGPFPHYRGVDDYIRQAADPESRPAGFVYDPEKDGTPLGSLGTHEHWNNAGDKQYSRNLGRDEGIELVLVEDPWQE
ncbi:MAG: DUF362 domain-containing protein [Spirochaetales bacterium]|nr:DUF362 domain-containing protein [Spirochaetales bacterium]